jgi:hypothetical protein
MELTDILLIAFSGIVSWNFIKVREQLNRISEHLNTIKEKGRL